MIGGWLFASLGWRSIFWFLTAVGIVLVVVGWIRLPETLPRRTASPSTPVALIKGYEEVGIHARFLLLSLVVGFNFNAFFLYIVSAPVFLGEHLHLGPQQYAWLFLPCILGIMIGSQLSGRAAGRYAPTRTVQRAYFFMGIAAIGNLAYAFALPPALPWAVIPIMIFGIGFAMAMPSVTLITLDLFPTRRGMAASLQGFVSGMVNVVTAGVISPALRTIRACSPSAMFALMSLGFGCWRLYLHSARRKALDEPTRPAPEL